MSTIEELILKTEHRPWQLPAKRWQFYQEWNDALFLHFPVSVDQIAPHIPKGTSVDSFDGKAWLSVVAFTMHNVRPRNFPAFSVLSTFHEVNLRTYVQYGGISGVYFFRLDASKRLSSYLCRRISAMPYTFCPMNRKEIGGRRAFQLGSSAERLSVEFSVGEVPAEKSARDIWLTERYGVYAEIGGDLFRYEVHHLPWPLRKVKIDKLRMGYDFPDINPDNLALAHYSEGVRVVAWNRQNVNATVS